jgi:SAM-dependent methyltransferase
MPSQPSASTYAYDNDRDIANQQLRCLSEMLDPFTIGRLESLGDLTGGHCLTAGSGGSQVPLWLADRVGPTGTVTATDIKAQHIPDHPSVRALTHDITQPIPDTTRYDVIHARLLLMHLAQRESVLRTLAAALAPGGALVIEDWYLWPDGVLIDAPTAADADLFDRYQRTVINDILIRSGTDPTWAARTNTAMRHAGLASIETAIHAPVWTSGSPGTLLGTVNLALYRDRFRDAGITENEIERITQLLTEPGAGLTIRGHLLFSTIGRSPAND